MEEKTQITCKRKQRRVKYSAYAPRIEMSEHLSETLYVASKTPHLRCQLLLAMLEMATLRAAATQRNARCGKKPIAAFSNAGGAFAPHRALRTVRCHCERAVTYVGRCTRMRARSLAHADVR